MLCMRCGLFLPMLHISRWFIYQPVCLSVCPCVWHRGDPAKTAESIEMPIEEADFHGSRNHVLDGAACIRRVRLNDPFAAAMRAGATITVATCSTFTWECSVTDYLSHTAVGKLCGCSSSSSSAKSNASRSGVQRSETSIKQMLLDWCRSKVKGYRVSWPLLFILAVHNNVVITCITYV